MSRQAQQLAVCRNPYGCVGSPILWARDPPRCGGAYPRRRRRALPKGAELEVLALVGGVLPRPGRCRRARRRRIAPSSEVFVLVLVDVGEVGRGGDRAELGGPRPGSALASTAAAAITELELGPRALCEPLQCRGSRELVGLGTHCTVMQLNPLALGELDAGRGKPLASNLHAMMNVRGASVCYGLSGCAAATNGHPVAGPSVPTSRSPFPPATRARSRLARTRSVSRLSASLVDFFIIV
jgi:hypothetical protein